MRIVQKFNPQTFSLIAAAVLGTGVAGPLRAVPPTPPQQQQLTQQQLIDKVNALETEVHELKAQKQQGPSASDVDRIVKAVITDADDRSKLGSGDFSIRYIDNALPGRRTPIQGLIFKGNDGNFLLNPWVQFDFRYVANSRDNATNKGKDNSTQNGFEVRKLKLGLEGNIFTPDLTYLFQFNEDRKSGNEVLELAWAKYHFAGTPFFVRAGQFKDPFDHEQLTATRWQVAEERTLIDDLFANAEGFVKGVSVGYNTDTVRAEAAFSGGMTNTGTNFQGLSTANPTTRPTNYGAAARVEYKAFGNWLDYDRFSAYFLQKDLLVFGLGGDWTEKGQGSGVFSGVADVEYGTNGLLLYGAYLGRYTRDNHSIGKAQDTYDSTLRAQASYLLGKWEPYVQYEFIHFDPGSLAAKSETTVHEIDLGTAYYLHGHNAKVTVDLEYLPNGSPVSDDGSGVLLDNHHSELVFRRSSSFCFNPCGASHG